jgi:capsular polysaccharide transport system ATP-binding protein
MCGAEGPSFGQVRRHVSCSWPLGYSGSFAGSLTGVENLRFVCRIYGADIAEVTDFVIGFSELGSSINEPVKTYSTGMRSRLAFGLSMAIRFQVYVIDELLAAGDVAFQRKCNAIFAERRAGSDVIMVSHSIHMIKQYCTRAGVLNGGKLTMYDTIDEANEYYLRAVS